MPDEKHPHHSPQIESKAFVEACSLLANAAWERFKNRREIEWKLCFGIWTSFGAAAGFLAGSQNPLTWWQCAGLSIIAICVCFIYGFLWAPWIQRAHFLDSKQSYWWTSAIEESIGVELPENLRPHWPRFGQNSSSGKDEAKDAPNSEEERTKLAIWRSEMQHPNAQSQLGVTVLFALLFVIAAWSRHDPTASTTRVSASTTDILNALSWPHTVPVMIFLIAMMFRRPLRAKLADLISMRGEGKKWEAVFQASAENKASLPEPGEKVITEEDVKVAMQAIPGMDPQRLEGAYREAFTWLRQHGIVTSKQLHELVTSGPVLSTLRILYCEDLRRPEDRPLDPVAVATWGVYLLKHGVTESIVDAIRQQIRRSPEYKSKH